jgi:methylenetetrahydrofolate reductase (NADPH)
VLAGVFVPRSAKAARYLRDQVPGIDVPEEVIERLDSVPGDQQRTEGIRLALDIVEEVRAIPGVSGLHLMTIRNEESIVEVIERAGLLPRPSSVPQTVV